MTLPILVGIGVLLLLVILSFVFANRYVKVPPNAVLIVSGSPRRIRDPRTGKDTTVSLRIVKEGGTFVLPVYERCDILSLELVPLDISIPERYTLNGIRVTLDAVAQFKIRFDDASIFTAAKLFLSKTPTEMREPVLQVLQGCLQEVLAQRTIEEVYKNRGRFADDVLGASNQELSAMGLELVTFTIREITDSQGYLDALAQPRVAEVKKEAILAEALARRDAEIREAETRKIASQAQMEAELQLAKHQAEYEMKRAEYVAMVEKKRRELGLGRRCPCGSENLPDSKFCNQCGKPL